MKHFALKAAVLVVLATIAVVANGVPCTSETCPPGPVEVYFTGMDCTGTAEFYEYGATHLGVCQVDGPYYSFRYEMTADYLLYTESNNPTCDVTLSNATFYIQQNWFGRCSPRANNARNAGAQAQSYMVLMSVNSTYTTPQSLAVNTNYPNANQYSFNEACVSPTNCTRASDGMEPSFITSHAYDGSCNPSFATALYNKSLDGTCYREGEFRYTSMNCLGENSYAVHYYTGDGCQNVYYSEYSRSICIPGVSGTKYTCLATPTSMPVFGTPVAIGYVPSAPSTAPVSSTNSLLPSFLFVVASVLALLF